MQSPSYKPKWFFFVLFAHVLLIIIWQPQYQCENDKSCHKSTKKLNGTKNMTVNWLCVNESFHFTSCTSLEKRLFLAKFNTIHLHLGLGPILIAHWIFVLFRSTWSPQYDGCVELLWLALYLFPIFIVFLLIISTEYVTVTVFGLVSSVIKPMGGGGGRDKKRK